MSLRKINHYFFFLFSFFRWHVRTQSLVAIPFLIRVILTLSTCLKSHFTAWDWRRYRMFWKHASSPHKGWTPRMLNFSLRLALACSRYQLITFIAKNITKEIRSKSSICKNCGSKRKTLPLLKKKKKTTTLMIINFRILVSLCNTLKKRKEKGI